jgi:hypothetical protein
MLLYFTRWVGILNCFFIPYPLTSDYYPYHVPKMNWSDIIVMFLCSCIF